MSPLRNENTLRRGQSLFYGHSFFQPQTEEGNRHAELFSPSRKTLRPAVILDEPLTCFSSSVPKLGFGGESSLDRPSIAEPPRKIVGVEVQALRPFADCFGFATELDDNVCCDIGLLLTYRRPSTVLRAVTEAPVNSVDSCAGRALPHIRQEVIERLSPPVADKNPFSSVCRVLRVVRAVASGNHILIRNIGRTLCRLGGVSVFLCHLHLRACKELIIGTKYVKHKARIAGVPVELPGLTKRRGLERDLCLEAL